MQLRRTLNVWSSCLSYQSAEVLGVCQNLTKRMTQSHGTQGPDSPQVWRVCALQTLVEETVLIMLRWC